MLLLIDAIMALDTRILIGTAIALTILLILCIWLVIRAYQNKSTTGYESMIGEKATVLEWSKNKGRIRVQGEEWAAKSKKTLQLKKNDTVRVSDTYRMTLFVESL